MLPILLDFKYIKIYTQGIFIVLGFLWGAFWLWKHIKLTSYHEDDVFDGLFVSLFGGLFLGRVYYVFLHFKEFGFNFFKFILVNGYPGMNIIAIIVGFYLTLLIFCKAKKMSFLKLVDYFIAPFLLSLAIIKLGSFFSGNEIGSQTNFFLSLKYPGLDGSRHITPVYESIMFFIGTYIAHRIMLSVRREKYDQGFNLVFFAWYFSLVTSIFGLFYSFDTVIYGLSPRVLVSLVVLLTVSVYFLYYFRAALGSKLKKIMPKRKKI